VLVVEGKHSAHRAAPPSCRRSTPQPRPGTGALDAAQLADDVDRGDPAKTRQLEVLVAQLVLVGMCAMLGCARCSSSGSSTGPWPGGHPPWCAGVEASVRCGGLAGGDVGAPGGCRHVEALGCLDAGEPGRVGAGERGRRAGRGLMHRGSSAGLARPTRCGPTRSLRMRGVPNIRELSCHPTAPVPGRG